MALVKALSEGHSVFTRIAVVADTDDLTPPCGPCRQLLWEYCGDIEIVLANLAGATARYRLSALLPMPFDARLLEVSEARVWVLMNRRTFRTLEPWNPRTTSPVQ